MQFLGGGGGAFAPNAPSWIRHWIIKIIWFLHVKWKFQLGLCRWLQNGLNISNTIIILEVLSMQEVLGHSLTVGFNFGFR